MTIRRMSLRHIEAFRAVVQSGSMTAAASRMHTSQPQVSRLIAQLEAITQFSLFERNGSKLAATLDGSRFYQEVEKTFIGLAGLESAAASIRSFSEGRLSVAAMPRLAGGLLARIVVRFKTIHPEVMVSIQSGDENTVFNWINSGRCDAGLAMLYNQAPGLQIEAVTTMNCVAILPAKHRLSKLTQLQPADFSGEPYISFPNGSPLRDQVDSIFRNAHVSRQIVAEASLGTAICALVGAGLGISILNPMAAYEEQSHTDIVIRPFSHSIPMTIGMLYPPYETKTRLVTEFAECAREVMLEELLASGIVTETTR